MEMPKYACHKQVHALKIAGIKWHNEKNPNAESGGGATIIPSDKGFTPFEVDCEFMHKHKPQAGGYYVVYKDGYKSFSPANAFESGYTRL